MSVSAPRCVEEGCERAATPGDLRCELHRSRYGARPRTTPIDAVQTSLDAPSPQSLTEIPATPTTGGTNWKWLMGAALGCIATSWALLVASAYDHPFFSADMAAAAAAVALCTSSIFAAAKGSRRLVSVVVVLLAIVNLGATYTLSLAFDASRRAQGGFSDDLMDWHPPVDSNPP